VNRQNVVIDGHLRIEALAFGRQEVDVHVRSDLARDRAAIDRRHSRSRRSIPIRQLERVHLAVQALEMRGAPVRRGLPPPGVSFAHHLAEVLGTTAVVGGLTSRSCRDPAMSRKCS